MMLTFAMHLPDGFLDLKTLIATALCAAGGLWWALAKSRRELAPRQVPLLGLGAAFLFSAQMINFPVLGGVSGHLIGSTLIAVLLGVPAAVIVVTSVLLAQAFLFADGGVSVLGANIFNMGIVAPIVGLFACRTLSKLFNTRRGQVAAVAFGAWASTVAASLMCAGQLAWSGTVAWSAGLPALVGVHIVIGLGEGAISALAYYAILKARPTLLSAESQAASSGFAVQVGLLSLGLALFVAPFACPWPDGLEAVAQKLGFEHSALPNTQSLFSDYQIPGIHNSLTATALAGALGCVLALALSWLLARLLVRPMPNSSKT